MNLVDPSIVYTYIIIIYINNNIIIIIIIIIKYLVSLCDDRQERLADHQERLADYQESY